MRTINAILCFAIMLGCQPAATDTAVEIAEFPDRLRAVFTAKSGSVDRLYNFCSDGRFFSIMQDTGVTPSRSKLEFKEVYMSKGDSFNIGSITTDRTVIFRETVEELGYYGDLVFFSNAEYDLVLSEGGQVESTSNTEIESAEIDLRRAPCP